MLLPQQVTSCILVTNIMENLTHLSIRYAPITLKTMAATIALSATITHQKISMTRSGNVNETTLKDQDMIPFAHISRIFDFNCDNS